MCIVRIFSSYDRWLVSWLHFSTESYLLQESHWTNKQIWRSQVSVAQWELKFCHAFTPFLPLTQPSSPLCDTQTSLAGTAHKPLSHLPPHTTPAGTSYHPLSLLQYLYYFPCLPHTSSFPIFPTHHTFPPHHTQTILIPLIHHFFLCTTLTPLICRIRLLLTTSSDLSSETPLHFCSTSSEGLLTVLTWSLY